MPSKTTTFSVKYSSDWEKISRKYRNSRNYRCENCNTSFLEDKDLLHTHHIDRIKENNYDRNLKALCIDCHRREDEHEHMIIKRSELCRIYKLRNDQNIIKNNSWNNIYKYIDLSLHGLVNYIQEKRLYDLPSIGKQVVHNNENIVLDLYWEKSNIGVSKDLTLSLVLNGLEIYTLKDMMNKINKI